MINTIIYSKDRALQLKLLLDSLSKNCSNIFNINILYKFSNEEFESGYNKLIKNNINNHNIKFIKEDHFKKQTLDLLNSGYDLSCFFTDDDIIYSKVNNVENIFKLFYEQQMLFCFSLRLGKNVTKCYTMQTDNVLKNEEEINDFIIWDWSKHYLDFGYPLSVDGHIFRTKDIIKLTQGIQFSNPNTLEISWQIYDTYPKSLMASFKESKLVNSPNNIVQNVIKNVSAKEFGKTAKELNDLYLNNYIIDLESMNFSNIIGCHQEIELKFKKENNE